MDEIASPQDLVDCFKTSLLYVFFPELQGNTAGDALLLAIAEYVYACGDGQFVAQHCPNLFCCYGTHYMAYILVSWGATVNEEEQIQVQTPSDEPLLYLKRKTVGGKTCEWDTVNLQNACNQCDYQSIEQWRKKFTEALECCRMALQTPYLGGGSNWPEPDPCLPFCGVDKGCS